MDGDEKADVCVAVIVASIGAEPELLIVPAFGRIFAILRLGAVGAAPAFAFSCAVDSMLFPRPLTPTVVLFAR